MKRAQFLVLLSFSSLTNLALGQTEPEFRWAPTIEIGVKNFVLEEQRTLTEVQGPAVGSVTEESRKLDETLYFYGIGAGLSYGKWVASARIELPFDEVEATQSSQIGGRASQLVNQIERTDWSATLGYRVLDSVTLFGGYKYGILEQRLVGINPLGTIPNGFKQDFTQDGLFIGAAYSHVFQKAGGVLSLSVAYADLDSEFETKGDFGVPGSPDNTRPILQGPFDYEGDATGLSFDLRWSAGFFDVKGLQYNVSLRYQEYKMDGSGQRTDFANPNLPTPPWGTERILVTDNQKTTESFTSLSFGLQYAM